jgi:hypothetical protein
MGRVRFGRRRVLTRGILGACLIGAFAALLALGVGLLSEGEPTPELTAGSFAAARAVPAEGIDAFRTPSIGVPRFQLPSVPSTRPVADALASGIVVAVGLALLAFFGLLARTPRAFGSRSSHRIAPRGPPHPAVARP